MLEPEQPHSAWLSAVQSKGIVVTAAALDAAEAYLTQPVSELQSALHALVGEGKGILDTRALLRDVLGWPDELIVEGDQLPATLRVPGEGEAVLVPAYALRSADEPEPFVFLVGSTGPGAGFDDVSGTAKGLQTAEQRFERLLRETGVRTGLLTDGRAFRLVYAPKGERAGWMMFTLEELLAEDGLLLGAFHMLLNERRLLSLSPEKRLLGLLRASRAYKVTSLTLRDFSAFEEADFSFVGGINVLLGANGTGKTHVMKALYATLKSFEGSSRPLTYAAKISEKLANVFKPDEGNIGRLVRRRAAQPKARIAIKSAVGEIDLSLPAKEDQPVSLRHSSWQSAASVVYLPTRELLAMYEGFIAAYTNRQLSFDETYYDACVSLSGSPLRGSQAEEAAALVERVEAVLGGKVVLRGNRFYLQVGDDWMEAHLLAEGLRKIASVAYLLSNGSLTQDGIFFWDEPEANLNPTLITMVVDLLLELASQGVQIFVTTHDYLLSHKLSLIAEYKKRPDVPIRFFAFHRKDGGGSVVVDSGSTLAELPDNPILDEFARHYDFERELFDEDGTGESAR